RGERDEAAPCGAHGGKDRARGAEDADSIVVENVVQVSVRRVIAAEVVPEMVGVGEHVDPPEARERKGGEGVAARSRPDVEHGRPRLAARGAELVRDRLGACRIGVRDHHRRPLAGESPSPDDPIGLSPTALGNDRDPILQAHDGLLSTRGPRRATVASIVQSTVGPIGTACYASPMDLAGAAALVTGASRGVGRAIAIALATAGADVACAARATDAAPLKLPGTIDATGREIHD